MLHVPMRKYTFPNTCQWVGPSKGGKRVYRFDGQTVECMIYTRKRIRCLKLDNCTITGAIITNDLAGSNISDTNTGKVFEHMSMALMSLLI